MSRRAQPAEGLGVTLHTPGPVQKGLPSSPALLSNLWEEAELMFGASPGVEDDIRRNSLLTCAVGGGLECRPPGLPVNFREGAVTGLRLWPWGNPAGNVGDQERC